MSEWQEVLLGGAYLFTPVWWNTLGLLLARIGATYLLARLAAWLGGKIIDRIFTKAGTRGLPIDIKMTGILRAIFKNLFTYGVYLLAALALIQTFGIHVIDPQDLKDASIAGLKALAILFGAAIVLKLAAAATDHAFFEEQAKLEAAEARRIQTLKALLRSVMMYAGSFIAGIMVLETLGIRTTSIIASAGLASLAIGFGAQHLVRDIITGFFIIFENQFSVGEYVKAAEVTGVVEEVGLRSTRIREWTGQLHIVPNGEITKVTNYNRGHMLAVVDINLSYDEDQERAQELLRQVCQQAHKEIPEIVEVPIVQGVVEFAATWIVIRLIAYTLAGEQWAVERELRRRVKLALDEEGLALITPRRIMVHPGENPVRPGGQAREEVAE